MHWLIIISWLAGEIQHETRSIIMASDRVGCEMLAQEGANSIKRAYPEAKNIMMSCEEATL
jgi:hypothetical protein